MVGSLGAVRLAWSSAFSRSALEYTLEILAELEVVGVGCVRLHIDHEVQRMAIQPEGFPLSAVNLAGPAFQAIANVRFAELLRRGDSDPRMRKIVRDEEKDAIAGKKLAARFVDAKKLASFRQSFLFRQSLGPRPGCYLMFHR
ncbi:MAG: hypothetical protein QOI24_504 [Acidobacteriota bacterium]|nr:hypothetical protein [Acidobacteriota bacterium]